MNVWFTVIVSLGQLLSTFSASFVPKSQEVWVCFWINCFHTDTRKSHSSLFCVFLYLAMVAEICVTSPSVLPEQQHSQNSSPVQYCSMILQISISVQQDRLCHDTVPIFSSSLSSLYLLCSLSYQRWCVTLSSWEVSGSLLKDSYTKFLGQCVDECDCDYQRTASCFFPSMATRELLSVIPGEGVWSSASGLITSFQMDSVSTML